MAYGYNISQEDNRKAIIGTIVFHILLALFLWFYKIVTLDPPFPSEEIVMEMDFSGSESAGGAPTQISESTESIANTEDVATQQEESPVTVTKSKTTTTSKTNSTTTTQETQQTQNPKYSYTFGQGNNGTGEGDKDGDGKNGDGDGLSGPGTTGKSGTGDGSSRTVTKLPTPYNPTQETGVVYVKVWIDRSGRVINAVAQTADPRTSTNATHISEAVKTAYKVEFSANPNGYEKETKIIAIKFELQ